MSNIWKFYYNTGTINTIYIFVGDHLYSNNISLQDIKTMYLNDRENPAIKKVFESSEELDKITQNSINVEFIDATIYPDDNIETVKFKLLAVIREYISETSFEELYLYGFTDYKIDRLVEYNRLTDNNRIQLDKTRLIDYLNNIGRSDLIDRLDRNIGDGNNKDNANGIYTLEDFYNLELPVDSVIRVPIGQRFIVDRRAISYSVDPFTVVKIDPILEQNSRDIISTTNKNLLFESGIINNVIYFTCLDDVIESIKATDSIQNESSLIKTYFPYLYNDDIIDMAAFRLVKTRYYSRTEKMLESAAFKQYNASITMFNRLSLTDVVYHSTGLKTVELKIHPEIAFNFPIDIVFRLINSNRDRPMIKYNPGKGQENIYRLYSDRRSTTGKKIPYLKRTSIFQLMKTMGMRKSVAIYCYGDLTAKNNKTPVILQFYPDGIINVKIINSRPVSLQVIQQIVTSTVNPILQILQERLENTGYKFQLFNNILDANVEVINLQYYSEIEINKNINLTSIKSCISNVFNINAYNLSSGGISMRYKRVSNYNEMNAIDSAIVELIRQEYRESDIVKNIVDNFRVSESTAIEKITSVVNNLQLVQNLYRTSSIKIKNNPGFQTTFERDRFKNLVLIDVKNIDHFEYIDNIAKFIDSIIRISQQIDIEERETAMISQLCKNRTIKTEQFIDDIIGQNELELKDDTEAIEEAQEIVFDDEELDGDDELYDDELDGEELDDEELMDFFMEGEEEQAEQAEQEEQAEQAELESKEEVKRETAGAEDNELKDLTGKNIANPTPFFKKLREYEPTLFLTENDSKFKSYSRICPSNIKRQPVLLTDSEKERIDREHGGSYDHAIKYGSSPDNQYWYICPRYWSLRDGVSLTQEQVDSGEYGTIIPHDAKTVPPGGNIYEFNSSYHQDSKGDYKGLHPGFMEANKHPDGKCIPCCFKTWDTPSQLKRRQACESGSEKPQESKSEKDKRVEELQEQDMAQDMEQDMEQDMAQAKSIDREPKRLDEYIKGPEKFPLETNKWGYIPVAVQTLLQSDMRKCFISKLNTNLKPFVPCLLRRGINQDPKTSFISAIADVYSESMNSSQFLQLLTTSITIDNFARYNNGNLVLLFKDTDKNTDESQTNRDKIDISQFSKTKIYQNIDISNPRHIDYLKKVVKSYNNFISFLNDKSSVIDHTYLWDIICSPDKNLFIQGANLIIFDITQTDSTENVNIVCPTNHYSSQFFDPDRKTILLIKKDRYYEPIYAVEDTKLKFSVTKLFNLKNRGFLPELKRVLSTISRSLEDKCGHKPGMRIVDLKKNLSAESIINIVLQLKFEIDYQVVDYNNKVIGLYINRDDLAGYLPTYPSAIYGDFEIPIKFMDDVDWTDYNNTRTFLDTVYVESGEKIACLPRVKIVEDKMIVGLLTNGNQFVKLVEPEIDATTDTANDNDNDLITQEERDYIAADVILQTSNDDKQDETKRIDAVRNIELEASFYKMFRNILRKNLGERENLANKNKILDILADKSIIYLQKLREIIEIVREVMEPSVIFSEMSDPVLANIRELVNCNKKNGTDCGDLDYCMTSGTGGDCMQIIPVTNLINGLNNEDLYYGKIADELIRYKKLQQFIIDNNNYLSLSKIEYDIRENEIFIIQSLLNQRFFEGVVAVRENQYVKHRIYDGVNPDTNNINQKTPVYNNLVDLAKTEKKMQIDPEKAVDDTDAIEEKIMDITDTGCSLTKKQLIGYLQEVFPPQTYEIYYKTPQSICSYEIMMNIMRDYDPQFNRLSVGDLKKNMVDVYRQYRDDIKILVILLIELNKKVILERVLDKSATMDEMLLSDEYYLTYIDMILIAKYYNLPIILISSMPIMDKMSPDTIIIPNKMRDNDKWYFIKVPSIVTRVKRNDYPVYKLLTYTGDLKIDLDVLARKLREDIERHLQDPRDVLTFLIDNIKPKKKYRLKLIDKVKPAPNRRFKIIE